MSESSSIRSRAKALLSLHSWSGIVLGMLLYAVIFTGTVAVVADEIGEWSNSNQRQDLLLSQDVNHTVSHLAAQTPVEYHEEITVYESHRQQLVYFFHTHKVNSSGDMDEYGVQYLVSPEGQVIERMEGFGSEIFAADDSNALSRFLVSIHTELHIPAPWGLILTGILGLTMLVAAVSGFMMHRHLFTDMFAIRKQRDGQALKRDSHTVAGTWSIPFAILLAFTGSFFSFATAFGLPAMGVVAFGGDQEALMHTLVGEQMEKSMTAHASADLNAMIADAASRQSLAPAFVTLSHWQTESASLLAFFMPSEGNVGYDQLVYDATNGHFKAYKPLVGTVPSAGSAVMSLIYPVHFGTFAGLMSKMIWIGLGVAACYVTITGLQLYAHRKEQNRDASRWFSRLLVWGFSGLPLCSMSSAWGFFISKALHANQSVWTPLAFVIAAAVVTIFAMAVRNISLLRQSFWLINGMGCLVLPILRYASSELGWVQAAQAGMLAVLFIDLALMACAALCFYQFASALKRQQTRTTESTIASDLQDSAK